MAEVIEVNDLETLASSQLAWNALLPDTPRASFFHTLDWLQAYWRHFGQNQKLRVLIVRAANQTIGIVPLCVTEQQRRLGKVRVLTYPLESWGMWYSPLGSAQAATLQLAMRHVANSPRDWDMIDLPWVDHAGADRGRTAQAMHASSLAATVEQCEATSIIRLDTLCQQEAASGWEAYLASLSPKIRQETRRTLRRLDDLGQVEHVRHRPDPQREGDGDPAWDLYDACQEIAAQSWQAEVTDGNTLCHESYQPFFRETHALAARLGMVDLNLLKIDGQPVAYNYNYHYAGNLFGLRMGYRADLPHKGIGKALLMLTIKESFERGDQRFELGVGEYAYKQKINTDLEYNYRLTHAPLASWRSQAVQLGRWMKARRTRQALG